MGQSAMDRRNSQGRSHPGQGHQMGSLAEVFVQRVLIAGVVVMGGMIRRAVVAGRGKPSRA